MKTRTIITSIAIAAVLFAAACGNSETSTVETGAAEQSRPVSSTTAAAPATTAAPTVPLIDKTGTELNTELEYITLKNGARIPENGRAEQSYSTMFASCSGEKECIVSQVSEFCEFRFAPSDRNRCEAALYDACERNTDWYDGECAKQETSTTAEDPAPTTTIREPLCLSGYYKYDEEGRKVGCTTAKKLGIKKERPPKPDCGEGNRAVFGNMHYAHGGEWRCYNIAEMECFQAINNNRDIHDIYHSC